MRPNLSLFLELCGMCVKLYCMYVVEVFHPQAYDALIIMQDGW